jgi:hypothetical protein
MVRFALFICAGLLTVSAFAAPKTSTKAKAAKPSVTASKAPESGIRVALVKPFLDFRADLSRDGRSVNARENLDQVLGVSAGYAHLPVRKIGWTSNFTVMEMEDDGETLGLARIDGNVGYAVLPNLNFKGGLNLSKFIAAPSEDIEDLDAQFGFQASIGIHIAREISMDLGWVTMHQADNIKGTDVEFRQTGIELGLNGTF